uniref:Beta-lactamase-related domain-containing protein n=1 Tax=Bionectria ochroleuca TaxID=29856 RepID=A0A8H7NHX5_BIOOC
MWWTYGGYADVSTKKPWERDTVVNVFSTSKLVTNLAALMLISRGVLHPDDKVAQHWPEFAANGKSEVTVSQVLTHTAGICAWQDNMMLEDVCDIEAATDKLANQATLWAPGTAMGYHGITQGFLIGELVALGSVNGHTNARALVKILSCFSLSGTCAGGGYRLLSAETVKLVLTEHAIGTDVVTGRSGRRGLGIYLTGPGSGIVEGKLPEGSVGWGSGWGGSIVVVDSDRRLTLAYAMNRMLSEEHPSPAAFIKAVYEILGVTIAA